MKKSLLKLFVASCFTTGVFAQCPAGDVTLSTQTEVDNYSANFGCTEVDTLYIGSPDSATNINDLSALSIIEGVSSLRIYNTDLVSLNGLDNLISITEDLEINSNELLQNLSGLENLLSVGDDFEIKNNPALTTIADLTSLTQIVDDLEIEENDELTSISVLSSISGTIDDLKIVGLPKLNNLVGLEGFNTITDDIQLIDLPLVPNLNPLSNITSVTDKIEIIRLNITSLSPLSNIEGTVEGIEIEFNPEIISLDGLQNIEEITDDLILEGNDKLSDISQISFISGDINDLIIIDNNLSSLSDLSGVTGTDNLFITESGITSLNGLQNIVYVSEDLVIEANPGITSLTGLEGLESANNFVIIENNGLTSFNGLNTLEDPILEDLVIGGNPLLTSIHGFDNIKSVSVLIIADNAIENVDTLSSLTSITSSTDGSFIDELSLESTNLFSLRQVGVILQIFADNLVDACGLNSYIRFGDAFTTLEFDGGITWPDVQSIIDNCDYCPTGNFEFSTQLELVSFVAGLDCTDLSAANLTLTSIDITSLSPLSTVTALGNLTINDTSLTDFTGTENVGSIVNDLRIENNGELLQINALSNLISLGKELIFINNPKLNSIGGLANLAGTIYELNVEDNAVLPNLNGLEKITTIDNDLEIINNAMLSTLGGLTGLTTVNDDVEIYENNALINLNGLDELTTVGDDLEIYENPVLSDITALSKVTGDIGSLAIYENNLMSLNGLQSITRTDDVEIAEISLTNLSGISGLVETDEFSMELTPIVNFTGVNANLQITAEINISDNPELTSLNGLPQQTTPDVGFYDNPKLASINAFDNITEMRSLQISGNAIIDLDTFSNLELVSTNIETPFLPPTIIEEANLETVNLTSLVTIEEVLRLETPALLDACGLFNFVENGNGLDKLDIIDGGFSGAFIPQDIIDICGPTLDSDDFDITNIQFFPNPTKDYLTISGLKQEIKYNLVSVSGNLLETATTSNLIDLSKYSNGIYFIEIEGNVIKVIKE